MSDLFGDWPSTDFGLGGLQLGPDGDLLMVDGDSELRQRVSRRVLTNNRQVVDSGTPLPSDYIFDNNFGTGARRWIGSAQSSAKLETLRQQIRDGVMGEEGISPSPPPDVSLQPGANNVLFVSVTFTSAASQRTLSTPRIALA